MFLLPGLLVGTVLFGLLDHRAMAIATAPITLVFVGMWFRQRGEVTIRPRSSSRAVAAALTSGVTTMVAHSGGPPLAMYLLPLGHSKELYAGTASKFFTVGNAATAVPGAALWTLMMAICLPAIPLGVWLGWRLHHPLDQRQVYRLR